MNTQKYVYDFNDKKYIIVKGKRFTLYRIISVTSFLCGNNNLVTYGKKGGYCALNVLSQEGRCWIDEKSIVGPNCYVSGDAQVENSLLAHDCSLGERALVSNSKILPASEATIRQNGRVCNSEIVGSLQLKEDATIFDSKIKGRVQMEGQTYLIDSEVETLGNGIMMVGNRALTNVKVVGSGTVGISDLEIIDKSRMI